MVDPSTPFDLVESCRRGVSWRSLFRFFLKYHEIWRPLPPLLLNAYRPSLLRLIATVLITRYLDHKFSSAAISPPSSSPVSTSSSSSATSFRSLPTVPENFSHRRAMNSAEVAPRSNLTGTGGPSRPFSPVFPSAPSSLRRSAFPSHDLNRTSASRRARRVRFADGEGGNVNEAYDIAPENAQQGGRTGGEEETATGEEWQLRKAISGKKLVTTDLHATGLAEEVSTSGGVEKASCGINGNFGQSSSRVNNSTGRGKDNDDAHSKGGGDGSLDTKFEQAVRFVRELPTSGSGALSLGPEKHLRLYALFKRATEGRCTAAKPNRLRIVASKKWEAWNALSSLSSDSAKKLYVDEFHGLLRKNIPSKL